MDIWITSGSSRNGIVGKAYLGEGDDKIQVHTGEGNENALFGGQVTSASGHDQILLYGNSSGGSIDTGSGDDLVSILGGYKSVWDTQIMLGQGNDQIFSRHRFTGWGLQNYERISLDTGKGDDIIDILLGNGSINGGDGYDIFYIDLLGREISSEINKESESRLFVEYKLSDDSQIKIEQDYSNGEWSIAYKDDFLSLESIEVIQIGDAGKVYSEIIETYNQGKISPPSTPDLSPASDTGSSDTDNLTSDTTPTFTGTADAGTTVELFADGSFLGTTATDSEGSWSFTVPDSSALPDGAISITSTVAELADAAPVLQTSPIATASLGRTTQEFRNDDAFAALKEDGSVITWGNGQYGGNSSSVSSQLKSGVTQIFSNANAFAALKDDGSVVTWGDSLSGGDSSSVSHQLNSGVTRIFSTSSAFAALKDDGSVITWGNGHAANSSSVSSQLQSGVIQVFSSTSSFAALKDDGSVVTWPIGDDGDSSSVASSLKSGVTQIFSTKDNSFAALKDDGSVVTWGPSGGYTHYGGDSSSVTSQLQSGVTRIFSTSSAFAALKDDGSVVAWGNQQFGGAPTIKYGAYANEYASYMRNALSSGVSHIFSNDNAFAALKDDGSVVTWGDSIRGGNGGSSISGVQHIYSTATAFAALLDDGSAVSWGGWRSVGGNQGDSAAQLQSGKQDLLTNDSFAALKDDGSVVTWGGDGGGDSSSVSSQLKSGVSKIFYQWLICSPERRRFSYHMG